MTTNTKPPIVKQPRVVLALLAGAVCGVLAYWLWPVREGAAPGNASDSAPATPTKRITNLARPSQESEPVRWMAAALAVMQSNDISAGDDESVAQLAAQLRPGELPAVLANLLRRDGPEVDRQWGLALLRHWAEADPRAAAGWLEGQQELADRGAAMEQVAVAWAGRELVADLEWVLRLPAGPERQHVLVASLYEGSQREPTPAMNYAIRELPAGAERDDLLKYSVAQWAATEPVGAWDWAKQLEPGELRDRIVATVATEWSESDAVAGATLAVKELPVGRLQDDAIVSIVERWVQVDPASAADWVLSGLPDGKLRQTAVTEMVKIWAEQDIEEVGRWLAELQPGPVFVAANAVYQSKLALATPPPAESGSLGK